MHLMGFILMLIVGRRIRNIFFGLSNLLFLVPSNIAYADTLIAQEVKPITIAVRKFKNFAGDFAENGVVEGANGEKLNVGFFRDSFEISVAEMLTTELSNTGHFNVVVKKGLYSEITFIGVNFAKIKKHDIINNIL